MNPGRRGGAAPGGGGAGILLREEGGRRWEGRDGRAEGGSLRPWKAPMEADLSWLESERSPVASPREHRPPAPPPATAGPPSSQMRLWRRRPAWWPSCKQKRGGTTWGSLGPGSGTDWAELSPGPGPVLCPRSSISGQWCERHFLPDNASDEGTVCLWGPLSDSYVRNLSRPPPLARFLGHLYLEKMVAKSLTQAKSTSPLEVRVIKIEADTSLWHIITMAFII